MTSIPPAPGTEPPARASTRRWTRVWGALVTAGLGLLGALVGLSLFVGLRPAPAPVTKADIHDAVATSVAKAAEAPARSTRVFSTILPSLVLIQTEGNDESADGSGIGSGVIVRDDGMILTAHHVVDGARAIKVTFADGTQSRAEVLDTYPNDLAVLLASRGPELIVPAVLSGAAPQVGDETFAVGNPLGFTASLSGGVISGLNRTISPQSGGARLTGLIQFDAAVNPGSSGGPLLNREGQVIGIVTALANPTTEHTFSGIGFAVPLGTAGGPGGLPR
ncbi:MAG: trypsin-like peptidase domain-containing protein [Dehalococcoidia bacterium]